MPQINKLVSHHRTNLDHMNYYYFQEGFCEADVNKIIEIGELHPKQTALTGAGSIEATEYRTSEVAWIHDEINYSWIFDRISEMALVANKEMWNYDLWGYQDGLQYTIYYDNDGHYDWHVDLGPGMSNRKLSCVIQLSDPSEYEGGELQMNTGSQITSIPKQKGLVTFFSSFVLHRVTPVTKGVRKSLVAWISGPNLR
jgi:PKHD-type hydroxylase